MTEYERRSAELLGARHAIGFSHARHALMAILQAAGLERGDGIALSPVTCKVVPLSLIALGLRPIWIDTAEDSLNLDPSLLEGAGAAAILFQYTYGTAQGAESARAHAERSECWWIEDRAHSMPLEEEAPPPAGERSAAIFSNNLLKPLPAGSGGLAVTDSGALAQGIVERREDLAAVGAVEGILAEVRNTLQRLVLRPRSYWGLYEFNRRVSPNYGERRVDVEVSDEIHAAARRPGRSQQRAGLRWLDLATRIAQHRRECCRDYAQKLAAIPGLTVPRFHEDAALLYFPIVTSSKYSVVAAARKRRVELNVWPTRAPIYPLDRLEALDRYGYEPGSCPRAEELSQRLIGLPTHERIDARERRRTVELLAETVRA